MLGQRLVARAARSTPFMPGHRHVGDHQLNGALRGFYVFTLFIGRDWQELGEIPVLNRSLTMVKNHLHGQ